MGRLGSNAAIVTGAAPGMEKSHAHVLAQGEARFGAINVLVNDAGVSGPTANFEELSVDDYNLTVSVDQHGAFYGIKSVIPSMRKADGGSIINISSIAGFVYQSTNAAYSATKIVVRGLTKAAVIQYATGSIRADDPDEAHGGCHRDLGPHRLSCLR